MSSYLNLWIAKKQEARFSYAPHAGYEPHNFMSSLSGLLQGASALLVSALLGFGAGLGGGLVVQGELLGLASLGLSLTGTNVGKGGFVDERLELRAGAPAHVNILDERGAELLRIVGSLSLQAHIESAKVAKVHTIAKQELLAYAIHQLGGNADDIALVVLGAMTGHVLSHIVHTEVLRVLRHGESLVPLFWFTRHCLAKYK